MTPIFSLRNTIEIDRRLRKSFMSNVLFHVEHCICFLISNGRINLHKGYF